MRLQIYSEVDISRTVYRYCLSLSLELVLKGHLVHVVAMYVVGKERLNDGLAEAGETDKVVRPPS